MSQYYIGALAFSDFNAISHGRPKGSRNGYTTMSNYKPIGKPARGKYDPRRGYYIYDNAGGGSRPKSKYYMQKSQISSAERHAKAAVVGGYKKASKAVSSAYGKASSAAGSAYGSARKSVGSAYRTAKEYLTGANARSGMERSRSERGLEAARAKYLKTLPGQVGQAYNTVSRYAKTTYKTVSEAVNVYKDRAQKAITEAYTKAANWINSNKPKVQRKVQRAVGFAQSLFGTAVSKVSEIGSSAVKKVKGLFDDIFGITRRKIRKNTGNMQYNTKTREGRIGTDSRVGTVHGPHKAY